MHPRKHEMLQQPYSSVKQDAQHYATGSVPLKLEADGSLTVSSIGHSLMQSKRAPSNFLDDDFANSKAEDDPDAPFLKHEETPNDSPVKKEIDLEDSSSEVDPYAQASLEAMRQRNTRKKK